MTATDMVTRWNHDMNTFIAVLFQICIKNLESKVRNSNHIRVRFMSQTDKIAKYQIENYELKNQITHDQNVIKGMSQKIIGFRRDKD